MIHFIITQGALVGLHHFQLIDFIPSLIHFYFNNNKTNFVIPVHVLIINRVNNG